MSSIILLGTGTCQIELERRASSVLIDLNGTTILFDCGRGIVQRLLEIGVQHNEINHIILSHFHPDHVSDLIPLLQAGAWSRCNPRNSDLHIYGPPGVQIFIDKLLSVFEPDDLQRPWYDIVVHEALDENIQINSYCLDFVSLPPKGNHGLRFEWKGKRYAITGDSDFHHAEVTFLRNVDVAIIDSGHIEDAEIVQLAVASQAKIIVCSHLYRGINAQELQAIAETEGYQGTIIVGYDFLSVIL